MKDHIRYFLKTLKGSCLSFDFYKSAAKRPVFLGILYILGFTLLLVTLTTGVLFVYVQKDLKPFISELSSLMPDCTFHEGVMNSSDEAPFIVEHRNLALAVYTGEEKGELDRILRNLKARNSFIVAREHLIIKDNERTASFRWSNITQIFAFTKITGKHLQSILPNTELYLIPALFMMILFFLFWDVMQILYFAAFGYLFSRISEMRFLPSEKTRLSHIFNIAIYASSPPTVMLFILFSFVHLFYMDFKPDHLQLLYMLMYGTFFIGGYYAYRKTVKVKKEV